MQCEEMDTLFLRMLHLFQPCRHLGFRTSVDKGYISPQPLGRTAGIHCRVASADDKYLPAYYDRRVGLRIGSIHEVDTCQILIA